MPKVRLDDEEWEYEEEFGAGMDGPGRIVLESEPRPATFTGLLDALGRPIYRVPVPKPPIGFVVPDDLLHLFDNDTDVDFEYSSEVDYDSVAEEPDPDRRGSRAGLTAILRDDLEGSGALAEGLRAVQLRRLRRAWGRISAGGVVYPKWLWPVFAVPGVVWLILLFLVPFYAVIGVAFGGIDPIFIDAVATWNAADWG